MPHKHKRTEHDDSQFNLPPTVSATSLPVGKARTFNTALKGKKRKITHIDGYGADDTPKAFQRLMAFSQGRTKKRSTLDDGIVLSKKQKRAAEKTAKASTTIDTEQTGSAALPPEKKDSQIEGLRIQPGESLSAFRTRVDQALPLTGLAKSSKRIPGLPDHRVTAHERRLKRLQKGWREEEARLREKEQEAAELAEEEADEQALLWGSAATANSLAPVAKKGGKKGKKRRLVVGEVDSGGEDEWDALQRKREGRKGLHDVVSAPPTFDKLPREIFKVKNGAGARVGNVPGNAGSLRKREELGEERRTIIDTYRELMGRKRGV